MTECRAEARNAARWIVSVFSFKDRDPELFAMTLAGLFNRYDDATIKSAAAKVVFEHKFPPAMAEIRDCLEQCARAEEGRADRDWMAKNGPIIGTSRSSVRIEGPRRFSEIAGNVVKSLESKDK